MLNENITKVGIVGLGFVGGAIAQNMSCEIRIVDKDLTKSTHTYAELKECDGIFVCVPTPMSFDGVCNTSILEEVLDNLKDCSGPIISKCTAPPTVYTKLSKQYSNLIHAPEFLTAANAKQDYQYGKFAVIGGSNSTHMNKAESIIRIGQRNLISVAHVTIEEAALMKYGINTFLATKIVFMNELFMLCSKLEIDYNNISSLMKLDSRIGSTHMKVPGQDGLGFDGMCFPKDTSALYSFAKANGIDMELLGHTIEVNKKLRKIGSK
jgi:UDPglucose 6-dehydrogenase